MHVFYCSIRYSMIVLLSLNINYFYKLIYIYTFVWIYLLNIWPITLVSVFYMKDIYKNIDFCLFYLFNEWVIFCNFLFSDYPCVINHFHIFLSSTLDQWIIIFYNVIDYLFPSLYLEHNFHYLLPIYFPLFIMYSFL